MPWLRRKKKKIKNIKLYIGIAIICILVAIVMNIFIKWGRDFINEPMNIADIDLRNIYLDRIKQDYKNGVDPATLEQVKSALRDQLDDEEVERLKEVHRSEKGSSHVQETEKNITEFPVRKDK